jgi:hypothetical protein
MCACRRTSNTTTSSYSVVALRAHSGCGRRADVCEQCVHRHRRELVCRLPNAATSDDLAIERVLNDLGLDPNSDDCTAMPAELRNVPYSGEHIYFDERQTVWRSPVTKVESAEQQRCAAEVNPVYNANLD